MERAKGVIVGGGIGGLAAAVALRRAGIRVEVHERAPELREVGAGIGLWSNAVLALDAIGLGAAVRRAGLPLASATVRTDTGRTISSTSLGELERRFGAGAVVVHRATLIDILRSALEDDVVHLGRDCAGYEESAEAVNVRFADGSAVSADFLVGADGLHSAVRARLHGEIKPRYAGYTAWRAVVRFDHARVAPGESWGSGTRFGMFPMTENRVYWFATANTPEEAKAKTGEKAMLEGLFAHYHDPIPAMIAATAGDAILRNDVHDRPPLSAWGRGRVTLLGDAAHAMTPNLGQGACQALEDAVVLAHRLGGANDVVSALRAYEAARIPRTSKIVELARRFGAMGQIENGVLVALRNMAMSMVPERTQMRQLDWLARFEDDTPRAAAGDHSG